MQIHSVLKRGGKVVGYETMTAHGRHFHVGQPPRTNQAPPNRCPGCQRYRAQGSMPCENCGALPSLVPTEPVPTGPLPMPVPRRPWYQTASAAPDMGQRLDDAIREQRTTGRVGNFTTHTAPARVVPLVHTRVALTFAGPPSTLDAVIARQRQTGLRPPDPHAPLHTMDATRCERCHRQSCNCPPKAPSVLDVVAERQAQRLAVMERAAAAAGLPPRR